MPIMLPPTLLGFGGNDPATKLLIHADGANGGTTLTDSSSTANAVTVNSGTTSTAQIKFGPSSYSPGNATMADAAWMSPGSSDWTFDFWMYWTSTASNQFLFSHYNSGTSTDWYIANTQGGGAGLRVANVSNTNLFTTASSVPTNAWAHIAIVSSGGVISIYINGVKDANTGTGALQSVARSLYINGIDSTTLGGFFGFLDEIRWSSVARWVANFTPPTEAYN
jgi:hypothetical protein